MTVAIKRLSSRTSEARQRALDRILRAAKPMLVTAREHLAPVRERIEEAEADETRILLYAIEDAAPLGVLDAHVHAPEPGDLTIAQIAVAKAARRRGIGRALVRAAIARAAGREDVVRALAAIHPENQGARAFWEGLEFAETEDRTKASVVLSVRIEAISDSE